MIICPRFPDLFDDERLFRKDTVTCIRDPKKANLPVQRLYIHDEWTINPA